MISMGDQLYSAAVKGDVQQLATLAETATTADLNYRRQFGHTTLEAAACHSDQQTGLAMVRVLLEKGKGKALNLNTTSRNGGASLLMLASQVASVETVQELINAGANVNYRTSENNGLLHFAVHNSDPKVVSEVLSYGFEVNDRNRNHTTPLMLAARHGVAATTELLLKEGADPRATDLTTKGNVLGWAKDNPVPAEKAAIEDLVRGAQKPHGKRALSDPAGNQQTLSGASSSVDGRQQSI